MNMSSKITILFPTFYSVNRDRVSRQIKPLQIIRDKEVKKMAALTKRDLLDFDFGLKPAIEAIERAATTVNQNTLPRFNKLIDSIQGTTESIDQTSVPRFNNLIDRLNASAERFDKTLQTLTEVLEIGKIVGAILAIYLIVLLVQKVIRMKKRY